MSLLHIFNSTTLGRLNIYPRYCSNLCRLLTTGLCYRSRTVVVRNVGSRVKHMWFRSLPWHLLALQLWGSYLASCGLCVPHFPSLKIRGGTRPWEGLMGSST